MKIETLAKEIVELVGGKDNIIDLTHCVTRLRFVVKDDSLVEYNKLEALDEVMKAQLKGGQVQVVIGTKVEMVFNQVIKDIGFDKIEKAEAKPTGKKENLFNRIIRSLSEILTPPLPAIIGGGLIKAILFACANYGWIDAESTTYFVLNIAGDAMFYFFPFLLAVSAAEKFKTNKFMALTLAGVLMYPSLLNLATAGEISQLMLFDIFPIQVVSYSSSVLPIIMIVWLLKYIYGFFQQKLPEVINMTFTPILTLLIMVPVSLVLIAPIGYYIGEYIGQGVQAIVEVAPVPAAFVIAGLRPLFVLTGVHHTLRPLKLQEFATNGFTRLGMMEIMSTMAQATAALGMYLILKNKREKQIALSATTSGYLGITEPALYGILVKYKVSFIAAIIGGGLGASVAVLLGGRSYAPVMASVLSIPVMAGDGFTGAIIGLVVTVVTTLAITIIFGRKSIEKSELNNVSVQSPVEGKVVAIDTIDDSVFAQELIGKSVAIMPSDGKIYAPFDGEVSMLYKTKHAIGLRSTDGIELLVHIGIDTVNLEGKYFKEHVRQDQVFKTGDLLIEFDLDAIKKEEYNPVVICSITNTNEYEDIQKALPSKVGIGHEIFAVSGGLGNE